MPSSPVKPIAIIGAGGAIGHAAAAECRRRSLPHRVIGRNRARLAATFGTTAEIVPADISELPAAEQALEGVASAVYCVGLPYPEHRRHPALL